MSGINYEVTVSIKDIFQSGKDVVCKMKGGLQVVERIGPVRQKQAGHERPVFLYHIVVKDALDGVIAACTGEKKSVQEELFNYMNRRGKK